jgi:DNA-directed RNA polymerase specialized sigma24 family protein
VEKRFVIAATMNVTGLHELLNVRLRRTCLLAWVERRSAEEIAAIQGITRRGVEQRLQRARHRLRAAGIEPPDRRSRGRRTPSFQLSVNQNV